MSTSLSRFKVVSLQGQRSWDVVIRDNRLVLVGENGTGKSTFATLVYYFLTRQWQRIHAYRFEAIEATLNGEEIRVTPELISLFREQRRRLSLLSHRLPPGRRLALDKLLRERPTHIDDALSLRRLADDLHLTTSAAAELIHLYQDREQNPELVKLDEQISSLVTEQVLFLPTYRRIEQDLQSIFPGSEEEIEAIRRRLATLRTSERFIELVEFGMSDVERTIRGRLDQIKEHVRTGLSNLTGTYLRDMIRGVEHIDVAQLKVIETATLEDILGRIGEDILPSPDKQLVKERVERMAERARVETEDTAVAHFLLKLLRLYSEQQEGEKDVREFVDVCNRYLSGKRLVYDSRAYTIRIEPTVGWEERPIPDEHGLQFSMLSSGEKQIVSLFSHMYLSGRKGFFVIIDEPELSLSVPWQRRFLPDILKTNECSGLIAATHSPFIWENELESYTRSLAEFVEAPSVAR